MNKKTTNPLLKQLISEIASKANHGRINDLSWGAIYESKKNVKKEADEKKPEDDSSDLPPLGDEPQSAAPATKAAPTKAAAQAPAEKAVPAEKSAPAPDTEKADAGGESPEDAEAEASKAKAKLAKAKAELDQANKDIDEHEYVKLNSEGGVRFLLGKVMHHAFTGGTLDELAGDMVEKLDIKETKDMDLFKQDMAKFMTIEGMPDLISSMESKVSKTPSSSEKTEEPA